MLSGWNQIFFVILSDVSSAKVGSTSPPTTWSVDEVVKFIEKSELAEHADMFKKHVSKFTERKLHLLCIFGPSVNLFLTLTVSRFVSSHQNREAF